MKMENDSATKIFIIVRGGTIQGVFCSENPAKVDILDYDDREFSDDKSAQAEFEIRRNNLFELSLQ